MTGKGGCQSVPVLEGEAAVREYMQFALQTAGYKVIEATDMDTAMEIARAHEGAIDVLLADEFCGRIRDSARC